MLDRIADCIQTSVSDSCNLEIIIIVMNRCIRNNAVFLFEVALIDSKYRFCIDIVVFEYPIDQIGVSSLWALSDTSLTRYPTSSRIFSGRLIPKLCFRI